MKKLLDWREWLFTIMFLTAGYLTYERLTGNKSQSFQAVAHIYFGLTLGAGCVLVYFGKKPYAIISAVTVALVELYAFLRDR